MNGSELNSTVKVGHLNGRYSYRSIGAVRVRATHADRDDGDELADSEVPPKAASGTSGINTKSESSCQTLKFNSSQCAESNIRLQKVEHWQRVLSDHGKQLMVAKSRSTCRSSSPRP